MDKRQNSVPGFGKRARPYLHRVGDGAPVGVGIRVRVRRVFVYKNFAPQRIDPGVVRHRVGEVLRGEAPVQQTNRDTVPQTVLAISGAGERAGFVNRPYCA